VCSSGLNRRACVAIEWQVSPKPEAMPCAVDTMTITFGHSYELGDVRHDIARTYESRSALRTRLGNSLANKKRIQVVGVTREKWCRKNHGTEVTERCFLRFRLSHGQLLAR
jgi:hypothetical protein